MFAGSHSRGTRRPPANATSRREVFDNAQVRHIFAQGEGRRARNGKDSMRCESDVLYSYRTPVAAFCPASAGRAVVLTSESYSVTTSQHVPRDSDFAPGLPVLRVPYFPRGDIGHGGNYVGQYAMPRELPNAPQYDAGEPWESYDARRASHRVASAHAGNLAWLESRARAGCERIAKDRASAWRETPQEAAQEAARYCEAFALPLPAWATDGARDMIAAAEGERAALIARRNSPANVRKREREAERRALAEGFAERCGEVFREVMGRDVRTDWRGRVKPQDSAFKRLAARVTDDSKLAAFPAAIREAYAVEIERNARLIAEANAQREREESEARAAYPDIESARAALPALAPLHGGNARMGSAISRVYPELRDAWNAAVEADKRERAERMERENREARERMERERREREAAKLARYPTEAAARDAWRASGDAEGFALWPNAAQSEHGGDMIRATDAGELVTARGARVPLRDARRAFRFIATLRDAGRLPFPPREGATESVHAGHFTLHSVTREGAARFGCHVFAWAEMATLAAALDARDAEAAETVSGGA